MADCDQNHVSIHVFTSRIHESDKLGLPRSDAVCSYPGEQNSEMNNQVQAIVHAPNKSRRFLRTLMHLALKACLVQSPGATYESIKIKAMFTILIHTFLMQNFEIALTIIFIIATRLPISCYSGIFV